MFKQGAANVEAEVERRLDARAVAEREQIMALLVAELGLSPCDSTKIFEIMEAMNLLFAIPRWSRVRDMGVQGHYLFSHSTQDLDDFTAVICNPVLLPDGTHIDGLPASQRLTQGDREQLAAMYHRDGGIGEQLLKTATRLYLERADLSQPIDDDFIHNLMSNLQPEDASEIVEWSVLERNRVRNHVNH